MKITTEIAKEELIKASKLGQRLFDKVCNESDSVGQGILGVTFALAMASLAGTKRVPLHEMHELLDMVHRLVSDADETVYEGAEKYGVQ